MHVWQTTFDGASRTLDVHVATLRAKLDRPGLIETVRGVGYRLATARGPGARRVLKRTHRRPPGRTRASAVVGRTCGAGDQASSVAVPPAAVIFSLAEAEYASTETVSATPISPEPSTLTGSPLRTAPLATRSSTVTAPPSG